MHAAITDSCSQSCVNMHERLLTHRASSACDAACLCICCCIASTCCICAKPHTPLGMLHSLIAADVHTLHSGNPSHVEALSNLVCGDALIR